MRSSFWGFCKVSGVRLTACLLDLWREGRRRSLPACLQEGLKVTPLRWDADGVAGAPSGPQHGSDSRLEQNRPQTQGCPGEGLFVSARAPLRGCVCMCSAPYGRKKRPRSVGIIFPIRVAQSGPERRESTEGDVDGSRMVSVEGETAVCPEATESCVFASGVS